MARGALIPRVQAVFLLLLFPSVTRALVHWRSGPALSATAIEAELAGTFEDRFSRTSFTVRFDSGTAFVSALPRYNEPTDNEFPARWTFSPTGDAEAVAGYGGFKQDGCEWFWLNCDDNVPKSICLIRRPQDARPLFYFAYQRGLFALIGHRRRLLLVSNSEASAENKVYVEDLEAFTRTRIDRAAVEASERRMGCKWCVVAGGEAFSADDSEVLVNVGLHHAAGNDVRKRWGSTSFWYSVSSKDGRIIKDYGSRKPAAGPWTRGDRTK